MLRSLLGVLLTAVAVAGCGVSLPHGYAIHYGDRGKSWLLNPDRTLTHPGLIKALYRGGDRLVLISWPATMDGAIEGPAPLDDTCYIALVVETQTGQMRQVSLDEARRMARGMTLVDSSSRECLPGTPTGTRP